MGRWTAYNMAFYVLMYKRKPLAIDKQNLPRWKIHFFLKIFWTLAKRRYTQRNKADDTSFLFDCVAQESGERLPINSVPTLSLSMIEFFLFTAENFNQFNSASNRHYNLMLRLFVSKVCCSSCNWFEATPPVVKSASTQLKSIVWLVFGIRTCEWTS